MRARGSHPVVVCLLSVVSLVLAAGLAGSSSRSPSDVDALNGEDIGAAPAGHFTVFRHYTSDGDEVIRIHDPPQVVLDPERHTIVTSDTVFTAAGSPYFVADTLIIDNGGSLIIEPGVMMLMAQDVSIVCLGSIHCVGTADSMITFGPVFTNSTWGGLGLGSAEGVARVQFCSITGTITVNVLGLPLSGAVSAFNSTLEITDCVIDDARDCGLSLSGCSGLIARNTLTEIVNEPMSIDWCSVHVVDNVIHDGLEDAIDYNLSTDDPVISGNLIQGDADDGIDLDEFDGTVTGNIIAGCADKGISASDSSHVFIENNVIWSCMKALGITAGSTAEIRGNTVTRCNWGLFAWQKHPGFGGVMVTGDNMLIWNNSSSIWHDHLSTVSLMHSNVEGDTTLAGDGNINTDPYFVHAQFDFHLSDSSACIDAGHAGARTPSVDFEGDPRVNDPFTPDTGSGQVTYVDIGADEFQPDLTGVVLSATPARPAILQVRPNPPGNAHRLQVELGDGEARRGVLRLFDVHGRLQRRFDDLLLPGELAWGGRDEAGQLLPQGIYFLRFEAGAPGPALSLTARIALVR